MILSLYHAATTVFLRYLLVSHAIREMEIEDERKKESSWHGLEEERGVCLNS